MLKLSTNPRAYLSCIECGHEAPLGSEFRCPRCSSLLDVDYDLAGLDPDSLWERRFADILPISANGFRHIETPCFELEGEPGGARIFVKVEGVLPTGSIKYRQTAIAVPGLVWMNRTDFVLASTGNTGSSYAYHAAEAHGAVRPHLFVPRALLHRIRYVDEHTELHPVDGDYVEAGRAAKRYSAETGIPMDGGFFNYFRREGLKAAYVEAARQVPDDIDVVFQAVSSGIGFWGGFRGFEQLKALGMVDRMPRFVCVQQEGCDPMVRAMGDDAPEIRPDDVIPEPTGLAEAILKGDPSDTYPLIRHVVRSTGGTAVAPTQAAIQATYDELGARGITACHTSAATLAACRELVAAGGVKPGETCLVMLTGGRDSE